MNKISDANRKKIVIKFLRGLLKNIEMSDVIEIHTEHALREIFDDSPYRHYESLNIFTYTIIQRRK